MFRFPIALGWVASSLLIAVTAGCDGKTPAPSPQDLSAESEMEALLADPSSVKFADQVESNLEVDDTIGSLQFTDTGGNPVRLDQYAGEKNVLLVFTRGFSGQLCPFCTTQTSRLIANYDKFSERDTEVLLVYPGQKDQLSEFLAASMEGSDVEKFPFPVLLDEDLAAVNQLNIAAQLAHPSTFIIDKQGSVKLSYVGQSPIDRPSVKALLTQLDRLQQ
jgi:peroxiredoxin